MTDENEIYRLVREGMMGIAMTILGTYRDSLPYDVQSQYENVEMLLRQYYSYQDTAMTAKVKSSLLQLSDDIHESLAAKSAIRYEYSIRRNWHISSETLTAALSSDYSLAAGITTEKDAQIIVLFRQVWLSGRLDGNVIQMLRDFVTDGHRDEFVRKTVVGAIMLRCLRYYDIRLVEILMSCPMAEAYVAVVMIAMARCRRIDADEESLALFRTFLSDGDNVEKITLIYNNVMRTFETQHIASEMRDKILPIVREQGMKFREEGSADIRLFDENGLNPQWEERLEQSGIIDKMRRINDMQLNGADIHYESFKMMKTDAFFTETARWFYPFDMRYHRLEQMNGFEDDGMDNITKLINLCDSDRYSLFLMLKGMGIGGLKEALQNLGLGNCDEVREQLGHDEIWKETTRLSFATDVRFAVMNLYRFYNLAPNHSDMTSPFARIMPADESELGYAVVPSQTRYVAASVLFKARQWDIAYGYYRSVVDEFIANDSLIYQKMGYCKEKLQQWNEALDEYGKSDVIVPDDQWTLRHTAYCLRQSGNSDMAAAVLRKVMELDSENIEAIDSLADIYIEAADFAEAKPLLYKLEYVRGSHRDVSRLGYTLFMLGERSAAVPFLDKACFDRDSTTDIDLMKHAISVGNDENLFGEACIHGKKPSATIEIIRNTEVASMISILPADEQEKITTIINKIILEQ